MFYGGASRWVATEFVGTFWDSWPRVQPSVWPDPDGHLGAGHPAGAFVGGAIQGKVGVAANAASMPLVTGGLAHSMGLLQQLIQAGSAPEVPGARKVFKV